LDIVASLLDPSFSKDYDLLNGTIGGLCKIDKSMFVITAGHCCVQKPKGETTNEEVVVALKTSQTIPCLL
jgi:hypothetical protein